MSHITVPGCIETTAFLSFFLAVLPDRCRQYYGSVPRAKSSLCSSPLHNREREKKREREMNREAVS